MNSRRTLLALGTAAVACLLLAAYLFVPRPTHASRRLAPALRILVVDASASAVRPRSRWLNWVRGVLRDEAEEAARSGQELALIDFASEVGVALRPGPPERLLSRLQGGAGEAPFDPRASAGEDDASRLAAALLVARELASDVPREGLRVVLVGVAGWTGDDPGRTLGRLVADGAVIAERVLPPAELPDWGLVELELPARTEVNSPLNAVLRLRYRAGVVRRPANVLVEVENDGVVTPFVFPLEAPLGTSDWRMPLELGQAGFGRSSVRVVVRAEGAWDPFPENDELYGVTRAEGQLAAGVVARTDRIEDARQWLVPSGSSALAGLQFIFLTPPELGGQVADLDLVVSFDLPPSALPSVLMEDFVRRGGGWLATSGYDFLKEWIPDQPPTGLGRLLPLEPAPLEEGPRDVVLLVDGSGSMEGAPYETVRSACLDLVAAALPSDRVTLRFFTTGLGKQNLIKERTTAAGADREAAVESARQRLRLRVPRGDTFLLDSIEEFIEERNERSNRTLVLLLTDGREGEFQVDPEARAGGLLRRLAAIQARLRVIAIGDQADLAFCRLLCAPGDEPLQPQSLEDLREVFRREVGGAQVREGADLQVLRAPRGADSIAALVDSADEALPPLERYVKNRVARHASGGEVLWQSTEGEPLLAIQRVGLGRTALFSSLPAPGWAGSWTRRFGYAEPAAIAPLLRWLGRGPQRDTAGLRVELRRDPQRPGPGELWVAGLNSDWPAEVDGRVLEARGGAVLGTLTLVPPVGGDGRDPLAHRVAPWTIELERAVAASASGPPVLVLSPPSEPGTEARIESGTREPQPNGVGLPLPLELGVHPEFGAERPLLLRASGVTPDSPGDDRDLATPSAAQRTGARPHAMAPWALGAGLLLLFFSGLAARSGQGIARLDR